MISEEQLILVNEQDQPLGMAGKLEAHQKGLLHRAFSVFVFNEQGEMLLQQRAAHKYHSGGLWTNACCSHPRQGEELEQAAHRRLQEEMGFDCEVSYLFNFIYKAKLDNELTEHEFDHVFIGAYAQAPEPNPDEVQDWRYVAPEVIRQEIKENPEHFTAWFRLVFDKVCASRQNA